MPNPFETLLKGHRDRARRREEVRLYIIRGEAKQILDERRRQEVWHQQLLRERHESAVQQNQQRGEKQTYDPESSGSGNQQSQYRPHGEGSQQRIRDEHEDRAGSLTGRRTDYLTNGDESPPPPQYKRVGTGQRPPHYPEQAKEESDKEPPRY